MFGLLDEAARREQVLDLLVGDPVQDSALHMTVLGGQVCYLFSSATAPPPPLHPLGDGRPRRLRTNVYATRVIEVAHDDEAPFAPIVLGLYLPHDITGDAGSGLLREEHLKPLVLS